MDDLGDKLNSLLNDPNTMSRISDMAKSLMGGDSHSENKEPARTSAKDFDFDIDPAMIGRIASIMKKSRKRDDKHALLEAMRPYLSEKRREKLDKGVKMARLAGLAEVAAEEFGFGKDKEE